jgi:hypothetical protein
MLSLLRIHVCRRAFGLCSYLVLSRGLVHLLSFQPPKFLQFPVVQTQYLLCYFYVTEIKHLGNERQLPQTGHLIAICGSNSRMRKWDTVERNQDLFRLNLLLRISRIPFW